MQVARGGEVHFHGMPSKQLIRVSRYEAKESMHKQMLSFRNDDYRTSAVQNCKQPIHPKSADLSSVSNLIHSTHKDA